MMRRATTLIGQQSTRLKWSRGLVSKTTRALNKTAKFNSTAIKEHAEMAAVGALVVAGAASAALVIVTVGYCALGATAWGMYKTYDTTIGALQRQLEDAKEAAAVAKHRQEFEQEKKRLAQEKRDNAARTVGKWEFFKREIRGSRVYETGPSLDSDTSSHDIAPTYGPIKLSSRDEFFQCVKSTPLRSPGIDRLHFDVATVDEADVRRWLFSGHASKTESAPFGDFATPLVRAEKDPFTHSMQCQKGRWVFKALRQPDIDHPVCGRNADGLPKLM